MTLNELLETKNQGTDRFPGWSLADLLGSRNEPLDARFNPSGVGPGMAYGTLASIFADAIPGIGDWKAVAESLDAANNGNYGVSLASLFSALPIIPGIFVGKNSKMWDAITHAKAIDMESAGADARTIWNETGNWRGPDNKWRQEISDASAKGISAKTLAAKDRRAFLNDTPRTRLSDAYRHADLYASYPEAEKLRAYVMRATGGDADFTRDVFRFDPSLTRESMEDIIPHEIQHWIQQREGFSGGYKGPDADPFNPEYRNTAGEAEARAVQKRRQMDMKTRRSVFPEDSYDVQIKDLIFRK